MKGTASSPSSESMTLGGPLVVLETQPADHMMLVIRFGHATTLLLMSVVVVVVRVWVSVCVCLDSLGLCPCDLSRSSSAIPILTWSSLSDCANSAVALLIYCHSNRLTSLWKVFFLIREEIVKSHGEARLQFISCSVARSCWRLNWCKSVPTANVQQQASLFFSSHAAETGCPQNTQQQYGKFVLCSWLTGENKMSLFHKFCCQVVWQIIQYI